MAMRETKVADLEAVVLASKLLQRANVANPEAGLLTAADIQWSWRMPRRSHDVGQLFWLDGEEPVAAAFVTSWTGKHVFVAGGTRLLRGVALYLAMQGHTVATLGFGYVG